MKTNSTFRSFAAVASLTVALVSTAAAQRPIPGRPPVRPVPVQPVPAAPAAVRVTAVSLNVRTGPGPQFPVITAVRRGTVLTVRSARGGWLNVVGPGGRSGWVYAAHTVRVR